MKIERSKLLAGIMVTSLCFNAFIIGTGLVAWRVAQQLRTPAGRVRLVTQHLKLTDDQKEVLLRSSGQIQEFRKGMLEKNTAGFNELCATLSTDNPDYGRTDQLVAKLIEERSMFVKFTAGKIGDFIKVLTVEQRKVVVKKIEKWRAFVTTL